jgi:hypothetical protein
MPPKPADARDHGEQEQHGQKIAAPASALGGCFLQNWHATI